MVLTAEKVVYNQQAIKQSGWENGFETDYTVSGLPNNPFLQLFIKNSLHIKLFEKNESFYPCLKVLLNQWALTLDTNCSIQSKIENHKKNLLAGNSTEHTPCWSVLDFWKINLEKSSSTNWIFSLFQTGFLQLVFSKIKYRSTGGQCY